MKNPRPVNASFALLDTLDASDIARLGRLLEDLELHRDAPWFADVYAAAAETYRALTGLDHCAQCGRCGRSVASDDLCHCDTATVTPYDPDFPEGC